MHLVLSEMPKHILYGFQLFLPKGKVAHKTSAVSDLLGTLRDLKWHYKSVFKEQDPPLCVCAARWSSCSGSHLSFCSLN